MYASSTSEGGGGWKGAKYAFSKRDKGYAYDEREREWFREDSRYRRKREWESSRGDPYQRDYREDPAKRAKLDVERESFKRYENYPYPTSPPANDKDRYSSYFEGSSRHYFYYPNGSKNGERSWERYRHEYDFRMSRDYDYRYPRREAYEKDYRYEDWDRDKQGYQRDLSHRSYREHDFHGREFDRDRDPRDYPERGEPREFDREREYSERGGDSRDYPERGDPRDFDREREYSERGGDSRDYPERREPREFDREREYSERGGDPRDFDRSGREAVHRDPYYYSRGQDEPMYKSRESAYRVDSKTPPDQRASSEADSPREGSLPLSPADTPIPKRRLGFGQGLVAFEKSSTNTPGDEASTEASQLQPTSSTESLSSSQHAVSKPEEGSNGHGCNSNSHLLPPPPSYGSPSSYPNSSMYSHAPQSPSFAHSPSHLRETSSMENVGAPRDPRLRYGSTSSRESVASSQSASAELSASSAPQTAAKPVPLEVTSSSEALEPPPPPRPVLPHKDEVLHSIEKLDLEITKIEAQIQSLKRPKKPEQKHAKFASVVEQIHEENQEILRSQAENFVNLLPESLRTATEALYKEPSDLTIYHENINAHEKNKSLIAKIVGEQKRQVKQFKDSLVAKYTDHHETWSKRVKKLEEKRARREKRQLQRKSSQQTTNPNKTVAEREEAPHRRPILRSNAAPLGNARGGTSRTRGASEFVRSEEEFAQVIDVLREEEDSSSSKYVHTLVSIPDMIIDPHLPRFIDDNGLIPDPMAVERERKVTSLWTDEEKEIFLEKFLIYHKNFPKIAEFIRTKSTENVIWYYYANKRTLDLKKLREQQSKRRSAYRRPPPPIIPGAVIPRELANLGVTSFFDRGSTASPTNRRPSVGGKPSELVADERSRRSGGARPTLLSPSNPASPAMTNSPSDGDNRWNDTEKELFKEALEKFGNDFKAIAQFLGTKNPFQCKNYYHNYKKTEGSKLKPSTSTSSLPKTEEDEESESMDIAESASNWSEQEKADFLKFYESYGKSWRKISNLIPSKSPAQLKAYFKANKSLFDSITRSAKPTSPTPSSEASKPVKKEEGGAAKKRPRGKEKPGDKTGEKLEKRKKKAKIGVKQESDQNPTSPPSIASPPPLEKQTSSVNSTSSSLDLLATVVTQEQKQETPAVENTAPSQQIASPSEPSLAIPVELPSKENLPPTPASLPPTIEMIPVQPSPAVNQLPDTIPQNPTTESSTAPSIESLASVPQPSEPVSAMEVAESSAMEVDTTATESTVPIVDQLPDSMPKTPQIEPSIESLPLPSAPQPTAESVSSTESSAMEVAESSAMEVDTTELPSATESTLPIADQLPDSMPERPQIEPSIDSLPLPSALQPSVEPLSPVQPAQLPSSPKALSPAPPQTQLSSQEPQAKTFLSATPYSPTRDSLDDSFVQQQPLPSSPTQTPSVEPLPPASGSISPASESLPVQPQSPSPALSSSSSSKASWSVWPSRARFRSPFKSLFSVDKESSGFLFPLKLCHYEEFL